MGFLFYFLFYNFDSVLRLYISGLPELNGSTFVFNVLMFRLEMTSDPPVDDLPVPSDPSDDDFPVP